MTRKDFDVYVVMEIGAIVNELYRTKKFPLNTEYDSIVDFVERELAKGDFDKHREYEMEHGGDLPTIIQEWFEPKIIEFAKC